MICDILIMNMPLWINVYLWNKWCLNLESESGPVRNEFSPFIHQSPSGSMTTLLQHLQANSIPKNLQWSESVKWLRIYIIYKNFECLMGMPRGLDGPKTILLHIYRPMWFFRTWDEVKWLWSYSTHKILGSQLECLHLLMGQWPCCCSSTWYKGP